MNTIKGRTTASDQNRRATGSPDRDRFDVMPPNAARKKMNEPGQWNTVRIVSRGQQVEHWLNGQKILEFTRGSPLFMEAVAGNKFSKAVPAFGTVEKGHILLQEHGSEISFKNIKINAL